MGEEGEHFENGLPVVHLSTMRPQNPHGRAD